MFLICLARPTGPPPISLILRSQDKSVSKGACGFSKSLKERNTSSFFTQGSQRRGVLITRHPRSSGWWKLLQGLSQSHALRPHCQPEGKPTCQFPQDLILLRGLKRRWFSLRISAVFDPCTKAISRSADGSKWAECRRMAWAWLCLWSPAGDLRSRPDLMREQENQK